MRANKEIVKRVEAIYKWLDEQIASNREKAGKCEACGKCCDFEAFGHRLFVTSPEMIYFAAKIGSKKLKQTAEKLSQNCHPERSEGSGDEKNEILRCAQNDKDGRCSYQSGDKCTVYDFRFAGCRIFCCKGDARFHSDLTEAVIKKFKALCDEFKIPYRYTEAGTFRGLTDLL